MKQFICGCKTLDIHAEKDNSYIKLFNIYRDPEASMATDATLEKQLGGLSRSGKVPKQAKVKNKAAADLQITAEQLLREAKERELEIVPPPPKQKVRLC